MEGRCQTGPVFVSFSLGHFRYAGTIVGTLPRRWTMSADEVRLELHQFRLSHYNEKVRWALDVKGVPHKRISHLPGPHMAAIRKLTGTSETPVVRIGGVVVAGSADIIDMLEGHYPEPPLYPADPGQRRAALGLQARFDADVGPAVRRALFAELVKEPSYLCRIFASGESWVTRTGYRAMMPVVTRVMARTMETQEPAAVAAARHATHAALDRLASLAEPGTYLVGDGFSVADLTAASLLAPACNPAHPDMELPSPRPARIEDWLARWAEHPGAKWVHGIYTRHRPRRVLPLQAAAE